MELLTNPVDVEGWLATWKDDIVTTRIQDAPKCLNGSYTINSDGIVDVQGNVRLEGWGRMRIPIQFGNISGSFDASGTGLVSLYGGPTTVGEYYNINSINLTTLEYLPTRIGGSLYVTNRYNMITTRISSGVNIYGNSYTSGNTSASDMSIDERTQIYIKYLNNVCPDIHASILWLYEVDPELYAQLIQNTKFSEFVLSQGINIGFSDDVKNIANVALSINHRM